MKPSEVSGVLNKIATAIENSKNPRRDLVAQDLSRVVAAIRTARLPKGAYVDQMIDKHIRNMLDEFKKREFMVLEDQEAKDAIQEELYDAIEEIIDKWIADPLSYEHKLPSEVRD